MNILLVEPYYGGSHKAWADGYAAASAHEVRLITHPARFWKWRMHGGFLTLANEVANLVRSGWKPDVILASSMMDVAAFAGAVRAAAPSTPIAAYFHESQFTYPLSAGDKVDFTYQMKNWGSAAVSDLVIFNSEFHRSVFSEQAEAFLNAFPDEKQNDLVSEVMDQSVVLPVGIDLSGLVGPRVAHPGPPLIVWNQRWEHDKGPMELHAIVAGLVDSGVEFDMAMCGEVFVSVPPEFAEITALLGHRLIQEGFAERNRYEELLLSASVVISTAQQEFFGIGIVEGIAAGAHPVLPNRLVYPERIAALNAYPTTSLFDSPAAAVDLITKALTNPKASRLRGATHQYDWSTVARQYDETLETLTQDR
jgi:glycosyltransferase involved in cell wall biosynthesis